MNSSKARTARGDGDPARDNSSGRPEQGRGTQVSAVERGRGPRDKTKTSW